MNKLLLLFKNPKGILDSFLILKLRLIKSIYIKFKLNKSFYSIKSDVVGLLSNNHINNITKEEKEEIIIFADIIIDNKIIVFGKEYEFNYKTWNKDLISGYKWPNTAFSKIILKQEKENADVKFPWEISRLQNLISLAYAYKITEKDLYLKKYVTILNDWILDNPVNKGVNWTIAMEVSIRSVNILQSFLVIKNYLSDEITKVINDSLFQHFTYLQNNLEKGINTNNHYLSNLVGLIWLSIYFEKNNTLKFSVKELLNELSYQISDDGFSYEDSIGYHSLNLEMILFTLIFMDNNGCKIKSELKDVALNMSKALDKLIKPNKLIPLVGDMDSGRFLILNDFFRKEKRDFTFLLNVASNYYSQEFDTITSNYYSKLIFLQSKPNKGSTKRESTHLNFSGLYVLRNESIYCLIKLGNLGVNGIGGHSHNDQLSIVLSVNGEEIFIDSGTGEYTRDYERRSSLRRTSAHSTVVINDVEQNIFIDNDAFKLKCNFSILEKEYGENYFSGKIKYEKEKISHSRNIKLEDNLIQISDKLEGNIGTKQFVNFILAENIEISIKENIVLLKSNNTIIQLSTTKNQLVKIVDTEISKEYGIYSNSKRLKVYFDKSCDLKMRIL